MKLVAFINPSREVFDVNALLVTSGFPASSQASAETVVQLSVVFELGEPPTYAQLEYLHTLLFGEQRIVGYHLYDNEGHLCYHMESEIVSPCAPAIDTSPPHQASSCLGVASGLRTEDLSARTY